jgi:hypothetical protein
MIQLKDSLNNQFMFFDYLSTINDTIQQYLDNNNLLINYYCTYYNKCGRIHKIITSNTCKKPDNGYRFIEINELINTNFYTSVTENVNQIIIQYENLLITISKCHTEQEIEKYDVQLVLHQMVGQLINGNAFYDFTNYSKNISEFDVKRLICYFECEHFKLKLFKNIEEVHTSCINHTNMVWGLNLRILVLNNHISSLENIEFNKFPQNLHTLKLQNFCNFNIPKNCLPQSLHTLVLGLGYTKSLTPLCLPQSLQILIFNHRYNVVIEEGILPKSLRIICFEWDYAPIIKKNIIPLDYGGKIYHRVKSCSIFKEDGVTRCLVPELYVI